MHVRYISFQLLYILFVFEYNLTQLYSSPPKGICVITILMALKLSQGALIFYFILHETVCWSLLNGKYIFKYTRENYDI